MDTSSKASMSVFEKIATMKQWQSEQHEKLVKEQEQHREKLSVEQNQRLQDLHFEAPGSNAALNDSSIGLDDSSSVANEQNDFEDVEVIESDNTPDVLERSFISTHNEPDKPAEGQAKRIFPFLKRGQGLGRFRMSSNDLTDQRRRIAATIHKKKSPSPQTIDAKSEIAPRKEPPKPNKCPRANQPKPAIAPDKLKPTVPKKVPIPRAPFPLKLKLTQPKKAAKMETNATKAAPLKQKQTENKSEMKYEELPKSAWSSVLKTTRSEMNTLSPLRKVEQRELRIFERLEQLVDDSSFCSTNSVITRFMEGGYISSVQTTPHSSPSKRQMDSPLELEFPSSQPNPAIENARALLMELAALKFGPPPQKGDNDNEAGVRFLENNPNFDGNNLKLDIRALKSGESSSDEELSKELELTEEEQSKSSGSSDSESSSDASEVAPHTSVPVAAGRQRMLRVEYASSISSTEKDDSADEELMLGSAMHARLEQLQREVMVVQDQQSKLNTQRSELAMEKEMLARAIQDAEAQKKKYAGSKLQLQRENQKIDELKQQLEELQSNWKEKEVRWASAQASQRAQLRQLSLENKNLAHQIKELKINQGKKVHFAANLVKPKEKPQAPKKSALKPAMASSSRVEELPQVTDESTPEKEPRITCAKDLDDALRLYQSICCKDDSADTSLVTPRSINKAYFDLFKSDAVPSPEISYLHTPLPQTIRHPPKQTPVTVPDRLKDVMEGSSRLSDVSEVVRSVAPERTAQPTEFSNDASDIVKTQVHPDGTRQIWYAGGNTLKVSADGTNRRMVFSNGDLQESWSREGISRYFYAESRVWHETHRDGAQIISYPDGQKEVLKTDGSKEVSFPDGSSMCIDANGKQMANLNDGSKLYLNLDGSSVLELPNGLREIRTKDSTTLQYPDGTLRVKFPSGVLETKYPNGRVRVKDASGKLIMDTHCPIEDN